MATMKKAVPSYCFPCITVRFTRSISAKERFLLVRIKDFPLGREISTTLFYARQGFSLRLQISFCSSGIFDRRK